MISLVSCGIGDVLSLLRIWLLSFNSSAKVTILTSWSSVTQSGIVQTCVRLSKTSELSVSSLFQNGTATLLSMYWLCANVSLVFSTSELPAFVIASQLHIRYKIREWQLVYLNLHDLLYNHLDFLHDRHLGGPVHGDFESCNLLTSASSSGDLSTSFSSTSRTSSVSSFFSACCNSFSARTDLSPLSLTWEHELVQLDNSHRILRFSDSSFSHCSNN